MVSGGRDGKFRAREVPDFMAESGERSGIQPRPENPMKVFPTISSAALGLMLAPFGLADEAMELAQSRCAEYVAAFEAEDAAKVAALFAPDVRYLIDGTETVNGREAIEARSKAFFDATESPKVILSVESARLLTPDVLVEDGTAEVTVAGSPEPERSRYSATHVRKEGKWQIADLQ